MESKSYHVGDIISVTTRRLVSPRHMEGVYDILSFMSGDDMNTLALSHTAAEATPVLLEQFAWLGEIVVPTSFEGETWQEWLAGIARQYGEYHDIIPMHREDHIVKTEVEVLEEMGMADKIVIVTLDDLSESLLDDSDDNLDGPSPYGDINF